MRGAGEDGGREDGGRLQGQWKRADDVDPRHQHQLAQLLHRQLRLATRGQLARQAARDDRGLGVDRLGDAKPLDQACEPDAAGADARVGDGPGLQKRTLQILGVEMSGFAAPVFTASPTRDCTRSTTVAPLEEPEADQLVDFLTGEDRRIGGLPGLDAGQEPDGWARNLRPPWPRQTARSRPSAPAGRPARPEWKARGECPSWSAPLRRPPPQAQPQRASRGRSAAGRPGWRISWGRPSSRGAWPWPRTVNSRQSRMAGAHLRERLRAQDVGVLAADGQHRHVRQRGELRPQLRHRAVHHRDGLGELRVVARRRQAVVVVEELARANSAHLPWQHR